MCMLCVEIQKEYMKPVEVARAYLEIPDLKLGEGQHWIEVMKKMDEHGYKLDEIADIMYDIRQGKKNESKSTLGQGGNPGASRGETPKSSKS